MSHRGGEPRVVELPRAVERPRVVELVETTSGTVVSTGLDHPVSPRVSP